MRTLLQRWFGRPARTTSEAGEPLLAVQREAQTLRLELQERDRTTAALQKDLERCRRGESDRIAAALHEQFAQLIANVAGPVSHLLTQAHLLEAECKPVQTRDVLAVARRLVRVLEEEGMTLEGCVGDRAAFDPNRHEPLSGSDELTPGQTVVIRFVGVAHRGKILRKCGVEKAGE